MTAVDVLVWAGTLTFAAAGALVAIEKRFDIVGVLVLASVTAVGGGAVRDVVVGRLPPATFTDEPLLWAVAVTALAVFAFHGPVRARGRALYLLDGVGLAIFAALGAQAGIDAGLGPWGTVFAGAVSGVGGGVLRDVLSGRIPGILYRNGDFYATAAGGGALAVWIAAAMTAPPSLATAIGVVTTLAIRLGSRALDLELPVPRDPA